MAVVRFPAKLKVFIFKNKDFFIIKFLNKSGCVKKKIMSSGVNIVLEKTHIQIHSTLSVNNCKSSVSKLKKSQTKILVFKSILEQSILFMFKTVSDRFLLEGIGFKVWKKKKILKFKLGFSSPVFLAIPNGIKVSIFKQKKLLVSSISLHYLRIFGQKLKSLKIPDPYKKKGVRIFGVAYKLKIGKKSR